MPSLADVRRELESVTQIVEAWLRDDGDSERLPFGLPWCARYLPHYGFKDDPAYAADFHESLTEQLQTFPTARGSKLAVIAPREGAKSTVITLAFVIYCAVENLEPYIAITSDSAGQATERLSEVARELDTNDVLEVDYGDAFGRGPLWRADRIELRNGVVIQAFGTGQRVRGRRNRQSRPSLVVFDDVENNKTITSPTERQRAWRWATREVIPAGSADTNFLSVGSALHRECVAVRLGQLAGWSSRLHRAVHRWPDRLDMWDEWERLATNLADGDRAKTARSFYDANQIEMDAGAEVYWPSRWPLYSLMMRRAEVGRTAFDAEWNGVPGVEGMTEWPSEYFEDRPDRPFWFDDYPAGIIYRVLALDPSKGSTDSSRDYQAHVMVSVDRTFTLWVEAWMDHLTIRPTVARSISLATEKGITVDALVVETNEGLDLLLPEFQRQMQEQGVVLPLMGINNTVSKITRIRRTGSYLSRGQFRYRNTPGTRILVDQKRDFPNANHDDGPDAEEMAVRIIEQHFAGR